MIQTKDQIGVVRFIMQVSIVERINLQILQVPENHLFSPYKYVVSSRRPILTLRHLKEKRLNQYLNGFDYYFYNKGIDDIFPDSSLVSDCRDIVKNDQSLLTSLDKIIYARHSK